LHDDPLLGGVTDIDLFFVHSDPPAQEREIVRITDEVHYDVAHHSRNQYRQTREIRRQAWMGHCINGGKILYDPQHFLDFTQASVRGQFDRPDYVLARSRKLLEHARQLWLELQTVPATGAGSNELRNFLKAVELAANAVAGLNGSPLTERRFLQHFPVRAAAIKHPGLAAGLLGLLGGPQVNGETLRSWLPAWVEAYQALPTAEAPTRLHLHRTMYYQRGIEALLESAHPLDALWPLIHTWTLVVNSLTAGSDHTQGWLKAVEHLGLQGTGFSQRTEALDAFMDTIEELLDAWGGEQGA
jgi:hypothetical protein